MADALQWLASEGVLLRNHQAWRPFHQTFIEYCYALRFASTGRHLATEILGSEQGLAQRNQLLFVITYLRSTDFDTYRVELRELLDSIDHLRFHLTDLLLRWLGQIKSPREPEVLVLRAHLVRPQWRRRILRAIAGNADWFERLKDTTIDGLFAANDAIVDEELVPYLISLVNVAQSSVIAAIRPRADRSGKWQKRLQEIVTSIRVWQTREAADLLVKVFERDEVLDPGRLWTLDELAQVYPEVACRLVRLALDRACF